MIHQDGIIFGLLAICVAGVMALSQSRHGVLKAIFRVFPSILLVYFIPALLTTFGVIDLSHSELYQFHIDHLLPACLILMTLSLDLKSLKKLGPKCLLIFLAGTVGVVLGGPVALFLVKPFAGEALPSDAWKVLGTLAGSWIGGGVNQASMKAIFQVEESVFLTSVAVDIFVGSFFWTSLLLFLANKNEVMNKWLKADTKLIPQEDLEQLKEKSIGASVYDYALMIAVSFGGAALCRLLASPIVQWIETHAPHLALYNLTSAFFWVIILVSALALLMGQTPLRTLEHKGASKLGSVFLYLIVASIGMKIDLSQVGSTPIYFVIGIIWILFHGVFILLVTRLLKAPLFFFAVGSQANIGGAASAPIVASAFSPHLAPVGVILAVLGYIIGNYGAYLSAMLMRWVLQS